VGVFLYLLFLFQKRTLLNGPPTPNPPLFYLSRFFRGAPLFFVATEAGGKKKKPPPPKTKKNKGRTKSFWFFCFAPLLLVVIHLFFRGGFLFGDGGGGGGGGKTTTHPPPPFLAFLFFPKKKQKKKKQTNNPPGSKKKKGGNPRGVRGKTKKNGHLLFIFFLLFPLFFFLLGVGTRGPKKKKNFGEKKTQKTGICFFCGLFGSVGGAPWEEESLLDTTPKNRILCYFLLHFL